MRAKYLITLYAGIVLLPMFIIWFKGLPARPFLDELASIVGILAFALILVEFILLGRFRSISGKVGMDVTMRAHQLLARGALVLVVIHPFLYRTPFSPQRPWDPSRQLTLVDNADYLATGMLAWVLLPVLVVFAIYRDQLPFRYETWRLLHGIGAILIAGFALHHSLFAGRYSQDPIIAGYWMVMFAIAIFSLLFVYLFKPLHQIWHPWKVTSSRKISEHTWELMIEPDGHPGIHYQAGQFVWLNVGKNPFSLYENPFSISSAPVSGKALAFIIKELGDFTRSLGKIKPGDRAYVDGPHGNLFVPSQSRAGVALIAGGVGIAPLIGILRQMQHGKDPCPTILVYGNRVEEQIAHREELVHFSQDTDTEIIHVLSEPSDGWEGHVGMVDHALIRSLFGTPDKLQWTYILCGPPAMIEAVEEALIDLGISKHHILSERFNYD